MKILFLITTLFLVSELNAQQIKTISLEGLNEIIEESSDKLKIFNFWASWCGPCVREMPYFGEIAKRDQVEVHMVSLDFIEDREKAGRTLSKKGITGAAYLLDEKDVEKYMLAINKDWSGAIPATLFIDASGSKYFYEQAFEKEELEEIVNTLITK